jgi:hypothetical protein
MTTSKMRQDVQDLIDLLDAAATNGQLTIVDISHEYVANVMFDHEFTYNIRLYMLVGGGSPEDWYSSTINHIGLRHGKPPRIFYLTSAYNFEDRIARFWFEDKNQAMLFKLRYG